MTENEFKTYLKVQHELQVLDAKSQLVMLFEAENYSDIPEAVRDMFNIEELVCSFDKYRDCNSADNDTWQWVINEYMTDNHIEYYKGLKYIYKD